MNISGLSLPKLPSFNFPRLGLSGGKPTAGLLIRPTEVQLVWMKERSIGGHVRVPIEVDKEEYLVQAISKAVTEAGVKVNRLVVSIHSPELLVRFFSMPAIPRTEWDTAVQFEARKYIPFKINNLSWDYQVIPATAAQKSSGNQNTSGQQEVVFVGMPQEVFQRYQKALSGAGVQAMGIEPMSLSLARLTASATDRSTNDFVCLVDITRDQEAFLVIAKGGLPYLTRDVHLSAKVEGATPEAAVPSADARVQRLLSELRVSIDFFTREHPSAKITHILCFGEEAVLGAWTPVLSEQLHHPVEPGTTFMNAPAEVALPLPCAAAVGLIQKALQREDVALDFLKHGQSSGTGERASSQLASGVSVATGDIKAILKDPRTLTSAGLAAGAVLLGMWFIAEGQVAGARHRFNQMISQRPVVSAGLKGKDQKGLKPIQESAKSQLDVLKQVMGDGSGVAAKLDALARSLPDGVWLTGLTYDNKLEPSGKGQAHLAVSGACFLGETGQELTAIQDFEQRIKRNSVLGGNAQLGQIAAQSDTQRQYSYRTFQLNCQDTRKL